MSVVVVVGVVVGEVEGVVLVVGVVDPVDVTVVVGVVLVAVVVGDVVGVVRWHSASGRENVPETRPSSAALSKPAVASHAPLSATANQLMLSQVTAYSDSSTDCHLARPAVIMAP